MAQQKNVLFVLLLLKKTWLTEILWISYVKILFFHRQNQTSDKSKWANMDFYSGLNNEHYYEDHCNDTSQTVGKSGEGMKVEKITSETTARNTKK